MVLDIKPKDIKKKNTLMPKVIMITINVSGTFGLTRKVNHTYEMRMSIRIVPYVKTKTIFPYPGFDVLLRSSINKQHIKTAAGIKYTTFTENDPSIMLLAIYLLANTGTLNATVVTP